MEYDEQVRNRLNRVEGQIRGILKMMENQKSCKEIVTQLSAVRSAIDRAIGIVVSCNLVECVQKDVKHNEITEESVKEAVNLLIKSR